MTTDIESAPTEAPASSFGDYIRQDAPAAPVTEPTVPPTREPSNPTTPEAFTRDRLLTLIPEDIRNERVFQNINPDNPIEDLTRQFLHAQKLVGVDKLEAPKSDWPKEKWDAFYDRLGRPKTPGDYTAEIPEGLSVDDKALESFRNLAHEKGLTTEQFTSIMGVYTGMVQQAQSEMTQAQEKTIMEGLKSLQQEQGENFESFLKLAERGLERFGDDSLKKLITDDSVLRNHPAIIKHFHSLAKTTLEDAVRRGDTTDPMMAQDGNSARAILNEFEQKNTRIINTPPEKLSFPERDERDRVLKRRAELYGLAYEG